MTCSMNMIKLLLIHFTFVVEKELTEKRGNILGKDFQHNCAVQPGATQISSCITVSFLVYFAPAR